MSEEDKTLNDEQLEANESNDGNSTGEGESSESKTYTEAELNERLKADRKQHDKNWRERIKAASGEEGGEESSQKTEEVASDDVVLARLEARGVLEKDEQDYLLGEANRLKKSPIELLSDDYYTNKLSTMKKDKEQAAATPSPSSRTATNDRSNDLGFWMKQAEKGKLPPDAAMRRKVVARLAGR